MARNIEKALKKEEYISVEKEKIIKKLWVF